MPGLGAAEAERRALSGTEIAAIVQAEVAERLAAAAGYHEAGHSARAGRLHREAAVLRAVLGGLVHER